MKASARLRHYNENCVTEPGIDSAKTLDTTTAQRSVSSCPTAVLSDLCRSRTAMSMFSREPIRLPRPSDRPIVWAKLTAMFDR